MFAYECKSNLKISHSSRKRVLLDIQQFFVHLFNYIFVVTGEPPQSSNIFQCKYLFLKQKEKKTV